MIFLSHKTRTSLLEAAYKSWMDETFWGEHKGRKVECGKCGMLLEVGSLASNQATQHDIYQSTVLEEDQERTPPSPLTWEPAHFPEEGCYHCPVPGYQQGQEGHGPRNSWNLRWHFPYNHPQDSVAVV